MAPLLRLLSRLALELVGYALLVVWLTWPLAPNAARRLPLLRLSSSIDAFYSVWALAYGTHRLATAPLSLAQANIYFPTRDSFFFGPTALGALPLFAPIYLLTDNAVLATNVLLLAGLTTTAAALHEIVYRWSGRHSAGIVAACFLLASPWINNGFVPTAPHTAALTLFPVIIYATAHRFSRVRDALLLAGAIALQCLTDLMYIAPALVGPIAILGAIRTVRRGTRRSGLLLLGSVALACALLLPTLWRYAAVARMLSDPQGQSVWGAERDFTGFPLPQVLVDRKYPASADLVTLGLISIGGIAAFYRRRVDGRSARDEIWSTGVLWATAGIVLSLPLKATLFGVGIPTPRGLATVWIPAVANLRAQSRVGIAALFGAAILAGAAFAEICALLGRLAVRFDSAWLRVAFAVAAVAASVVVPHSVLPHWSTVAPPSPPASFVAALRQQPGPVLVLPTGDRRFIDDAQAYAIDPLVHARAMVESIGHWQPLLNGYSSYFPAGFREEMILANELPDPGAARELVAEHGLRYVWVRLDDLSPEKRAMWNDVAAASLHGFKVVAREDDQLLVLVPAAPGG